MVRQIEAYKLRTELAVDAAKGASVIKQFEKDIDHLGKSFEKLGATINKSMRSVSDSRKLYGPPGAAPSGGVLPGLGAISEIIQGIPQIGRLAGGLIRPLTDAAEEGIRLNMVLETAQIGFEGVAGSAEKAAKHIKNLEEFGRRSPFRFEGLLEASRYMTAFGFSLDEQLPKLTVWGNAIAASGELSAEKVQDVVRAFGQMRLAGRVNAQDMNQLTNAGIAGWELLAKAIGKSVAETRKLSELGRLKGPEAVEAITKMMAIDPRFKDMMKRQESTTAGRLSAAQDTLQFAQALATENLTRDIGDTLGAALEQQDLVGNLAAKINTAIAPVSGMIKQAAAVTLGGSITEGFVEGINAGEAAVKKAVGDFALNSVIGPVKGFLRIQSPSEVFADIGGDVVEGFEMGLVDRTSKGFDKWAKELERAGGDAFTKGIEGIAQRLGIDPSWLMNVIAFESGFNPRAANPGSSGRGLIQFMRSTARGMGFKSSGQITKLSALEQLPLVEQYFRPFAGKMKNQGDVYAAVAAGRLGGPSDVLFRKGSKEYAKNKIWDVNRDEVITSVEIGSLAMRKGGFSGIRGTVQPGSAENPLAVFAVGGDINNAARIFGPPAAPVMPAIAAAVETAIQGPAVVDIVASKEELIATDEQAIKASQALTKSLAIIPKAIQPMVYLAENAEETIETTSEIAGTFYKSVVGSQSVLTQLAGMIGSVAGFAPQETVGKKRGLFSKILGIAAPFLSFIPGVGPILSTVAGMASSAVGGDWAGVTAAGAGALSPGGTFRRGGSSTSGGKTTIDGRQFGGPVFAGSSYTVGEGGRETFIPSSNGWISPRGAHGGGELVAAVAELRAAVQHLTTMPAHQVVMRGARGMVSAMDHDAGLIRLVSQRQRLA
jgi:tape measure domain-containing protein